MASLYQYLPQIALQFETNILNYIDLLYSQPDCLVKSINILQQYLYLILLTT